MSNKIFNIDFNLGNVLDSDGGILMTTPTISYQAAPNWELHFVENVESAGSMLPVDVSQAVAWNAAVDVDFTDETQPMIRTLPSAIITSGAASGIIVVPLDANTDTFYQKINGRNTIPAYFEIRGRDSNDRVIYDYRFRINALGAIDPQGGEPLPVASGGVTMADVYALLRSATEYRFSADGTNWHSTQQAGDNYYQSRYPDGDWSDTIEIVAGAPGHNVQFKYSADGTTFHENPLSSDYYMAMSNDGGTTWTSGILFHGADGEDGTDGTNGVGFKLLGSYNGSTTYHPITTSGYYECVLSNGSTFAYINANASSGHMPPTGALSDSYWQMIARKGDDGEGGGGGTVYPQDVVGLDAYISSTVSAGYYNKSEIDSNTGEFNEEILEINNELINKADLSAVYTKTAADNLLSAKADKSTTYTKTEVDNALSSKADKSQLNDYTPLSTTQTVSAYLQNEIENIPTGGGLSGVSLNGEPQTVTDNVANIMALPIAKTMQNPNEATQELVLYYGNSITSGDSYVGALRSYDVVSEFDMWYPYLDMRINDSSNTGTNRVWSGHPTDVAMHTQLAYDNGWKLSSYYEAEGDSDYAWHEVGSLSTPDVSGQPWGRYYLSGNTGLNPIPSGRYWNFKPQADVSEAKQIWGCNIVTKCHLYELDEAWDDICIFVTIPSFVGSPTYLFKKKAGVTEWYEFNSSNAYIDEEGWYVKPNYSSAWSWDLFMGDTYHLQETTQDYTKMPWDYSGHLWRDTTLGKDIYPIIKRVFIGKWNDLGKITT